MAATGWTTGYAGSFRGTPETEQGEMPGIPILFFVLRQLSDRPSGCGSGPRRRGTAALSPDSHPLRVELILEAPCSFASPSDLRPQKTRLYVQ